MGRLLVGVGIGISAVAVPTYLGEVAPAAIRGRLVELYEVLLCAGMLGSVLADVMLMHVPGNWRWMVGLPLVPSVIMACEFLVYDVQREVLSCVTVLRADARALAGSHGLLG